MESAINAFLADGSYQSLYPWWELLVSGYLKKTPTRRTGGVFLCLINILL